MRFGGGAVRRSHIDSDGVLEGRKHRPDYVVAILSGILIAFGMVVMYSISPAVSAVSNQSSNYYFIRHLIAFAIGLLAMGGMYLIPLHKLKNWALVFAGVSVVLSLFILATTGLAFRWVKIGGVSFQPAEMMKLALLLWLGFFLAAKKRSGEIGEFSKTLRPVLYIIGVLAMIVVVLQRDLGSMVVLAGIAGIMLFVASVPMRTIMIIFLGFVAFATIAVASTPYRRDRFTTFLNPERDCVNVGYHACQAIITVGSGGLFGLGVGNSVQAYGYLPETATDSIFAIYAEKFGFVGSVVFVSLIGALILRLLSVTSRTMSWEARLVMIGIIAWLTVQSIINIGAMLALLPLKGITLPFVSYGGSSLIFVMMAIGTAMRISCYTSVRKHELDKKGDRRNESSTNGRGDRRTYIAPLGGRG